MFDCKKKLIENLQAATSLPVYYELICDSNTKKPCITYQPTNNRDVAIGDNLGYSRLSFYIKLWGENYEQLCDYANKVDAEMHKMGFERNSYNELIIGNQICFIYLYDGLGMERYANDEVDIAKLSDYLYKIEFNDWDYNNAKFYKPAKAACSSVTKGNLAGRNFDWEYDEAVNFVITCKGKEGCHDSIGVANSRITKTEAESKKWNECYAQLPFMTTDGVNDAGVYCNINVVPSGDKGITNQKGGVHKKRLCQAALVRYILDYADSADDAILKLQNINVYAQKGIECHLMIYDGVKSYVVEWVNNEMKVLESNILTNFYLDGWNGEIKSVSLGNSVEEVRATGLTDHAQGLERYISLSSSYDYINNAVDMITALQIVNYTRTYTNGDWYSEFNDPTLGLTIYSEADNYDYIKAAAQEEYQHRKRDGVLWITKHSAIYDIQNKILSVSSEEGNTHYNISL